METILETRLRLQFNLELTDEERLQTVEKMEVDRFLYLAEMEDHSWRCLDKAPAEAITAEAWREVLEKVTVGQGTTMSLATLDYLMRKFNLR